MLEVVGVIEIRRGSGCYLTGTGMGSNLSISLPVDSSPRQLLEVRKMLEPSIAHLCASRATRTDLNSISELLDQADHEITNPSQDSADRFLRMGLAFHRELARVCRNAVLTSMISQIVDAEKHPLWLLVDTIQVRNHATRVQQVGEHREILAAIIAGDAEEAAKTMIVHLGALSIRIFGAGNAKPRVSRTRRVPQG